MRCAQRRGKKKQTPSSFPGERCGTEGVTVSRCPARCQEPQGFERKPGRWLPSAPGTSCRCRSPKAGECTEKTNRSQPSSPLRPAESSRGGHGLLQPSCQGSLGCLKGRETLPASAVSQPETCPPVPRGTAGGGDAGGGSRRDGEQLVGRCGVPKDALTASVLCATAVGAPLLRENLGQGLILPRTRGCSWGCS